MGRYNAEIKIIDNYLIMISNDIVQKQVTHMSTIRPVVESNPETKRAPAYKKRVAYT